MPSEARQKKIMEKLNRAPKMLNFGASKPRVKGGPGPRAPPDPCLFLPNQFIFINLENNHLKYSHPGINLSVFIKPNYVFVNRPHIFLDILVIQCSDNK